MNAVTPVAASPHEVAQAPGRSTGHTVLAVPVPALEPWVRDRTRRYDASFVGLDAAFANAHITVLAPWTPRPTGEQLAAVARIIARHPRFEFTLERLDVFPNGVIHLVPEPASGFASLTADLAAAFPEHPPYGGQFGEVMPHLTLDAQGPGVDLVTTSASLGDLVPVRCRAERVDLQWWANDDCRRLATWQLPDDHDVLPQDRRPGDPR